MTGFVQQPAGPSTQASPLDRPRRPPDLCAKQTLDVQTGSILKETPGASFDSKALHRGSARFVTPAANATSKPAPYGPLRPPAPAQNAGTDGNQCLDRGFWQLAIHNVIEEMGSRLSSCLPDRK